MTDIDPDRLTSMLRLIIRIRESLSGINDAAFYADQILIDATAYRIQHIGEGARKLSLALRERHAQLPWERIVAMRNLLAHNYDYVDPVIVWTAATQSLNELEAMCRNELNL